VEGSRKGACNGSEFAGLIFNDWSKIIQRYEAVSDNRAQPIENLETIPRCHEEHDLSLGENIIRLHIQNTLKNVNKALPILF
jgi:hypothetical protein